MKTILSLFTAFFAAMIVDLRAEVISLTPDWFTLGTSTVDGTQVTSTYKDGIYTVNIEKNLLMTNQTRGAHLILDWKAHKGKSILIKAELRCQAIESFEKANHVGGKILCFIYGGGATNFRFTESLTGTRDQWIPVELIIAIPQMTTSFDLIFGIQQAWGTLEFRNPTMEILNGENSVLPKTPDGFICEYSDRIKNMSPRRGVMTPPSMLFCEKDIRDLAAMGVNLVRYQIVDGGIRDLKNLNEYDPWFKRALDHLDTLIPILRETGIQVILDMHWPPGGRYGAATLMASDGTESRLAGAAAARKSGNPERFIMQEEKEYREAYLRIWRETARRYKGNDVFYAYDLVNEPYQNGNASVSWWQIQADAAKAIREIDSEVPLMMEGNYCTTPVGYEMAPLPFKNIIYTIHMYSPNDYTHQGIRDELYVKTFPQRAFDYRARGWDREKLREAMQPAIDFQKKYHAKMQVGEFSVTIWAPGADQWLDDVISLFEEYHWDWTYHAFREWSGWSLEHEGTPSEMVPAKNTNRMAVLKKYWKRNSKSVKE